MPRPRGREPRIEVRTRELRNGDTSEYIAVRYYDMAGKRRRLKCESMAEAEFERARLALVGASARPVDEAGVTVGAFFPIWFSDVEARCQEQTVDDYAGVWRRRVEPRFADVEMSSIVPRDVARWRQEMLEEGIGKESIRRALFLLQSMFTLAVEWGEATTNPVALVRKPRQGRKTAIRVLDPDPVELLRAHLLATDQAQTATMMVILAYTGMRPGEMLALERRHFRQDTVLVEQSIAKGKIKVQKTGRVYRTVDLLDELREDVVAWCNARNLGPDDLLFPRSDGKPYKLDDYKNWRGRDFGRATRAVGLGMPRPYDLRHSFASLMIREQRCSIVDLAEMLGHSPTETLKTYAHVFREYRRQGPVEASALIREARAWHASR